MMVILPIPLHRGPHCVPAVSKAGAGAAEAPGASALTGSSVFTRQGNVAPEKEGMKLREENNSWGDGTLDIKAHSL